ncbi:MAG: transketolase, partial [Tepidanaerobacteraceae bacterium]|nr:transketolase [Tepidanaerobacteraceae bacterium]
AAAHYKLDNLTAFVDNNGLHIDGPIKEVMSPESIQEKFKAFGWNVIDIDGHDIKQIIEAIEQAKSVKGKPTVIVAKTIKGKGVPFMENQVGWHGKAPSQEQLAEALKAL